MNVAASIRKTIICCSSLLIAATGQYARCGDWPMWRADAQRRAVIEEELPENMALAWSRDLGPADHTWEDPVNQDRMPFDRCHEPIVLGKAVIVASARTGAVTAFDTATGNQVWQTFTDGPVRLPPAAWNTTVFCASDDGFLYALNATDGSILWKFRGGPSNRRVLGNGKICSAWPARGGPVVSEDGVVYFAAGIWPFMGVFIHALRADTGDVVWTNDSAGAQYLNQPHGGSSSFGGAAPQGAMAVSDGKLIVPCGRSVPAVFDAKTGKLLYYHLEGASYKDAYGSADRKLTGGSQVYANGTFLLNHRGMATASYDLNSGDAYYVWPKTAYPVLSQNALIFTGDAIVAYAPDRFNKVQYEAKVRDRKTREVTTVTRERWEPEILWQVQTPCKDALIQAGSKLYGADGGTLIAINVVGERQHTWKASVDGHVARLIAANERLFAVTLEGVLHAFSAPVEKPVTHPLATSSPAPSGGAEQGIAALLESIDVKQGWAVVHAPESPAFAEAVIADSELNVLCTSPGPQGVSALRRHFVQRGLYGTRVWVLQGAPSQLGLPPYFALATIRAGAQQPEAEELASLVASTRPYGGRIWFPERDGVSGVESLNPDRWGQLELASHAAGGTVLTRVRSLPGSANWTHLYGDAGNSAKSDDSRIRPPLGLLWFGGNTHDDILPRHGHGPTEQVVDGRLFIQGVNLLSARDVYTGAVLWRRTFDDLGVFDVYYDASYSPNPLARGYNQVHIPGANSRGTNYVATADAVYLLAGTECLVIDPVTGKTTDTLSLPANGAGGPPEWSFIAVTDSTILAGAEFADFSTSLALPDGKWTPYDKAASRELIALDRRTRTVLWRQRATQAFTHNGIVIGHDRVYALDRLPDAVIKALQRRGTTPPGAQTITCRDLRSGKTLWQTIDVFGTWLSYSADHDLLVQAGRKARDMLPDEPGDRIAAYRADTGRVLWDKRVSHAGPIMLHGDRIYFNALSTTGAGVELLTGEPLVTHHPISQTPLPWTYHRRYGCNSVIASEHLLTFRSGAAGYFDLANGAGTGNLGGFKSGCTSNLVVANGVLNAPDYTRTCTCSYQNQTSLALVHWPELEYWTANELPAADAPVQSLGLNLGAPGDRRDHSGTLWFDYPIVGGPSPPLDVRVQPETSTAFQRHSSSVSGYLPWVAASGLEGLQRLRVGLRPGGAGMETIRIAVADATDDAEEIDGKVNLTSSDLELTQERKQQLIAIRFRNVKLSAAAEMTGACIQFTVDEATEVATELVLSGELDLQPAPLETPGQTISGRKRTTASVSWTPDPWTKVGESGAAQRTPDVGAIITEIISQPGWEDGSDMVFIISGTGKRVAKACNGNGTGGPVLELKMRREVDTTPVAHTVSMVFAEPGDKTKTRVFDVFLQGQRVLEDFSPLAAAGAAHKGVVKSFSGVMAFDALEVEFKIKDGSAPAVISGLSIVRE